MNKLLLLSLLVWLLLVPASSAGGGSDGEGLYPITAPIADMHYGQIVTLRVLEGTDERGRQVRQVVCGFTGKGGDVLLGIVAGRESWDQALVERFLQSIR